MQILLQAKTPTSELSVPLGHTANKPSHPSTLTTSARQLDPQLNFHLRRCALILPPPSRPSQLINPATRENALLELSKKRENFPELAPYLWYSFGTIAALLQEIVSIYPLLSPPSLTAHASNRVCNALALLQCVASHNETRALFLQGAVRSSPCHAVHAGGGRAGTTGREGGMKKPRLSWP